MRRSWLVWVAVLGVLVLCPGIVPAEESSLDEALQLKKTGDYARAIAVLEAHLKDKPDDARAHYLLAWTYIGQGDKEKAKEHFEKTVALEGEAADVSEAEAALSRLDAPPVEQSAPQSDAPAGVPADGEATGAGPAGPAGQPAAGGLPPGGAPAGGETSEAKGPLGLPPVALAGGAGAVIVVLVLVFLLRRRKKAQPGEAELAAFDLESVEGDSGSDDAS